MKTKYVKLFEEYIQEQQLLTDPVKIKEWIDSWKDEIIETYVSKDDVYKKVPRLNGTYTIRPDGTVDVVGGVNLEKKELEIIPIQFGEVTEDFYCNNNDLTSLQGSPTSVGGYFYCYDNPKLKSLQYCPTSVFGNFSCYRNQLTSLKGCPTSVGGHFSCFINELTSLLGCPTSVGGHFYCSYNELTTLQYCPTSVGGGFNCSNNPKLITNAHNSNIKDEFYSHETKGTLEERILRYIEYLKPLDQQERDSSLDWLYSVEKDLHKEVMDYITKNNIDVISGRVKSIYTKTNTQNKRMPLL